MKIEKFSGKYEFLSNFYEVDIEYEGIQYPSVEHAYVAAKTEDENLRGHISKIPTAGKAKQFGRSIILRSNWDDIKLEVMEELLWQKFSKLDLLVRLIETSAYEIVEGNHWGDTFWGVCNGVGENHLGKLLMKIRNYHV